MTRVVGIILVVAAVAVCLLGTVLLGIGLLQDRLEPAGAVLGFGLLLVFLVGPLAAGGVLALVRGRTELAEQSSAEAQRKILDMVKARGQVNISDVIIELQSDLSTVRDMIYRLVGMGVFSGYINWDEGLLYSAEAASLRELQQCKHCGGHLTLAGRGVVKCPFCGTEYFLS